MQYINTNRSKQIKSIMGRMDMCFDEMQNYIWRLERRAIQLYPSIQAFCRVSGVSNDIFKRLRQRGLYSMNYLTLLRLCYGLRLSPNQIMRFEEWEDLEIATIEVNKKELDRIRIDWRKSMDNWYQNKKQKPLGKRNIYGVRQGKMAEEKGEEE